jgi:hypothetical protein
VADLNDLFSLSLPSIPAPNSVKNWILKTGLTTYNEAIEQSKEGSYSLITDESMMIGSEKLLLTLAVKSEKTEAKTLTVNDTRIIDISVASSWNSKTISDVFSNIETKTGQSPSYVISDNASIFNKAIRECGYTHIRDVSHSFALILKRSYEKDEYFNSFTKALSDVSFKENMKLTAYLLPPKQKTTARFMNVAPLVEWAVKMHQVLDILTDEEQNTYGFLREHQRIIQELSEVFQMYDIILPLLKKEGLSLKTARKSFKIVKPYLRSTYVNVREFAREVNLFLKEEIEKIQNTKSVYHCSSDIIESLFSIYKNRKSKNKLNGVTTSVLHLPVMTMLNNENKPDFKAILENITLKEIHQWKQDNLTENLVIKRRKILKTA